MTKTKLSKLRKRLARLRRRRRSLRWRTGYTALFVALLWVLVGAFLVDWLFEMSPLQRIVAMAVSAAVFVWAFRRYTRPWLGRRETELDVALLVERQQTIDSDLVAAIQFESPEAAEWGSVQLEQEVIDRTAEMGNRLNVMQGFSRKPLRRRASVLAVTCLLVALGVWRFPDHATAFLSRFFLLAPEHYPTRTVIESVRINGRLVDVTGWRLHVAKSPYGQPVAFEVVSSGRLPIAGHADLQTDRGLRATVTLDRNEAQRHLYGGQLPRLVDAVDYQIYLGDAWTDPARLEVVPLPTIDVELEVTPPSYAAAGASLSFTSVGLRQISVIEGSRVQVRVTSDKRLKEATLTVDGDRHAMFRDQRKARSPEPEAERWTSETGSTPLDRVVEPIRFEVRVVDRDDLELESPVQGVIRIKADHRPRIVASAVTEFVLPTAKPGISYNASDDYGLARLSILPKVTHEDGLTEELDEIVMLQVAQDGSPPRELEDRYALDLAPLELTKGDQLTITVQAVDYRGPESEGEPTRTEPLVFQVTDERGILAAMAEADRESVDRLKTMIQRQIEVGESQ
ncbi:DUF4175 family protein [Planctomycetota bacterium]